MQNNLNFSDYQFSFANAIKPEQSITIEVKTTRVSGGDNPSLGNRVSVKSDGKLALIGLKKESQIPLFLNDRSFLQQEPGGFL